MSFAKRPEGFRRRDDDYAAYEAEDLDTPSPAQLERLRRLPAYSDLGGGRDDHNEDMSLALSRRGPSDRQRRQSQPGFRGREEDTESSRDVDPRRRSSQPGFRTVNADDVRAAYGGGRDRDRNSDDVSPSRRSNYRASEPDPEAGRYREVDIEKFRERDLDAPKGVRFLEPRFRRDDDHTSTTMDDPRRSLQELSLSDKRGRRKPQYYKEEDFEVERDRYSDDETKYYGGSVRERQRSVSRGAGHRKSEDYGRRRRQSTYEEELAAAALPIDDLDGGSDVADLDMSSRAGRMTMQSMSDAEMYRSHDPAVVGMPRPKRIVICCDGTWLDADNALRNKQLLTPSNVTRIGRSIKPIATDGTPQVVFYQEGVGAEGGRISKTFDGVTGSGISGHIREAYSFLCNNYVDGDEIFFVGFSRGAFTARSIASMVSHLGLLTKAGIPYFPVIFEDFQHRHEREYRSRERDIPFPRKPSAGDPEYVRELARMGLTTPGVRIKAIGVWETVGSLGIPRINWLERVGLQNMGMRKWNFYDTSLNPLIEHAFQALALDEQRGAFQPAVWELKDNNHVTDLVQVWFPGVHSNVGGGYKDQEIANITLAWMMSMLSPFLDFDDKSVLRMDENNKRHQKRPRPWSFGKIYNSMTGVYAVGGTGDRTPGEYCRVDPSNGAPTKRYLTNTNEYIHPSVRVRAIMEGPGRDDEGDYRPKGLKKWRLVEDETGRKFWRKKSNDLIIPECSMGELEMVLLERSPKMYDYLTDPRN